MMARAFTFMRKKAVVYATDETIEQIAKDYEEAMKEAAEASSKAKKGKYTGENNPFYGKHHSEETRKKLSDSWDYDKHFTAETRKKLREAQKGKKFSEEHKKKIGASRKGKKMSEEFCRKNSEGHKGLNIGTHWYNNGKINIRAKECPPGFTPGRIK